MEIIEFDRRFHKRVFFNRLIIGIYSIVYPIFIIVLYVFLANKIDIKVATNVLIYSSLSYFLGFIVLSIVVRFIDKQVKYDRNKIHINYKRGFIISKTFSFIQFFYCNALLVCVMILALFTYSSEVNKIYELGDSHDYAPYYVYDLEQYKEYENNIQIENEHNVIEFAYSNTTSTSNFRSHFTTYVKFNNSLDYVNMKNNLFINNKLLSTTLKNEKGYYFYPITNFTIESKEDDVAFEESNCGLKLSSAKNALKGFFEIEASDKTLAFVIDCQEIIEGMSE